MKKFKNIPDKPSVLRKCRICHLEATTIEQLGLFKKKASAPYGRDTKCKVCHNADSKNAYSPEKKKVYYEDNKEYIIERQKQYRIDNEDYCKELRSADYIRHSDKIKAASAMYRASNPEKIKEMRVNYMTNNYVEIKTRSVYKYYGITYECYMERMSSSDVCEVCGTDNNLVYDHDHDNDNVETNFRDVLCNRCNRTIGGLGDNAEGLRKALNYLEEYENGN